MATIQVVLDKDKTLKLIYSKAAPLACKSYEKYLADGTFIRGDKSWQTYMMYGGKKHLVFTYVPVANILPQACVDSIPTA